MRGEVHPWLPGDLGKSCFQLRDGFVVDRTGIARAMPPEVGSFGSRCRTGASADRS